MGENQEKFELGNIQQQPNLYLERDPRNHIVDGEPRALYWWEYRETFERLKGILTPGEKIPQNLSITYVGNNRLNPFHFDIRKQDRTEVYNCPPGISAHITFSTNIHVVCGAIFDRDRRRQDHLYIIPRASMLLSVNYVAIYLPTPNAPLHIRIVHNDHLINPRLHLPPFKDRRGLAELFTRYKVV